MVKVPTEFSKMYIGYPVILICYIEQNGQPNISTGSSSFSLGNMMYLGFVSSGHAIDCIRLTRELVVNVPDKRHMAEIEQCGFTSEKERGKFDLSGHTSVPSKHVSAPSILECPISIECRVEEICTPASHPQYTYVIASIVDRKIDSSLLKEDGFLDAGLVDPVFFVGDHKQRMYRFANEIAVPLGDFITDAVY
ncbi:flavin reductase [Tumebacillus sp. DT12]|uniref:Flavin reductase n=1 Tax=Tumebacillus lacus TaxID=2995335 RepID=A0ABT3X203_9BACL|nr:flavin reductase [Tumebacillus lacus]MCX7569982.1 flavin reductase [Tumebacillus lacus]